MALLAAGCRRAAAPADPLRAAADAALARGISALASAPAVDNIGTAWTLQQLLRTHPDPTLSALVTRSVAALHDDPSARLIDPARAPLVLPADPGRGLSRLSTYLQAPLGAPPKHAAAYLAAFLASDEQGYVLTHQLLALLWAEQFDIPLPADAAAIRARLVARIIAEQGAAAPLCTDLYAERTALALRYGTPPPAAAAAWIEVIVAAQRPDGSWGDDTPSRLSFDGQTAPARHTWTHTSAFAVAALSWWSPTAPNSDEPE